MKNQDATYLLKELIQQKEMECAAEKLLLDFQFKQTLESLKPVNLIKDVFASSELKSSVVDTTIGLTTGYIAKKSIIRSSKNPLLKLLGTVVGMGVANIVTKHPESIKFIGGKLLNSVFKKEKSDDQNHQEENA